MPDGAKTLLIILLIPFLLSVGHDIYINYFSDDEKIREVKALRIDPQKFLISDAGWVWNEYAPSIMSSTRDMIQPTSTWRDKIDPILQLPTMVVGIIPWAITFIYLLFARLAGFWPCKDHPIRLGKGGVANKKTFSVYDKNKGKKAKFNR